MKPQKSTPENLINLNACTEWELASLKSPNALIGEIFYQCQPYFVRTTMQYFDIAYDERSHQVIFSAKYQLEDGFTLNGDAMMQALLAISHAIVLPPGFKDVTVLATCRSGSTAMHVKEEANSNE